MTQIDKAVSINIGSPDAFKKAVMEANAGDHIVYSLNFSCRKSPCRLMALGAYEAGLVLLVKKLVGERADEDSIGLYKHIAIRTKKAYRHFKEADPTEDY